MVAALAVYAAAFAVLSIGGIIRSELTVAFAAGLLVVAAIGLQLTLTTARRRDLLGTARVWVPRGMLIAGAVLIAAWFVLQPGSGLGLCGACAIFLGLGHRLAEWRWSERVRARGARLCVLFAGAFAAGVLLCVHVNAFALLLAVGAVLAGPIGLTLLSEEVLRKREAEGKPMSLLAAPVGLLAAAAGVLWLMSWADVPKELAWPLAGALLLLVGSIASSTQADVLLVLTVLGLSWTTIPAGATAGDELEMEREPTLAALGDSYMSGEGAQQYFEGTNHARQNECRRAPTAYAHELVKSGPAGELDRLAFFACSGAQTFELHPQAKYPGEPLDDGTPDDGDSQAMQLRRWREVADIRLIAVSIGGNDAGFSTIGMACVAPGSCVERGHEWLERLDEVRADVQQAYEDIRDAVEGQVPILAVPYPQPIRETSCTDSQLEDDEHRFLNGFVKQLNGAIRQAARDARVYYLDAMPGAFRDKLRICDGPTERMGVNFIALRSVNGLAEEALYPPNWIHNSLHPNETGHDEMGKVLADWLQAHPDPPATPRPEDRPDAFTPATLEELMAREVSYCGGPDEPDHCDRGDIQWAITQVGILVRDASLPALLVIAGCWLFWLPVLGRTRPLWRRLGNRVAGLAFGRRASPAASGPSPRTRRA
jgi:lysophospholipase L1-like esterase